MYPSLAFALEALKFLGVGLLMLAIGALGCALIDAGTGGDFPWADLNATNNGQNNGTNGPVESGAIRP